MPNAKEKLDQSTHTLQDQPPTADPARSASPEEPPAGSSAGADEPSDHRQPLQAQQRDVTGTTLPDPNETSDAESDSLTNDPSEGPKTGAAKDHPYTDDKAKPERAANDKASATPFNAHTEIDSEADLGDPSDR